MTLTDHLDARISPLNYQTGTFANLCQHDNCDVETIGDDELCSWHRAEAEAIADEAQADALAEQAATAFPVMRMTAKGRCVQNLSGQWVKVSR